MGAEANERQRGSRHRLVLVVMGVILVVGWFAKNAFTRFANMALYAKRSEGMEMLKQIHKAELQYFERHGEYVAVGPTPQRTPGKSQTEFKSEHMAGWKRLGWQPESMVRCQFEVTVPTPANFRAVARCDADGDGEMSVFAGSKEHPPNRISPDNHY